MKETWVKRIITVVASILLIMYVGYQIYKSTYTGVQTETVVYDTLSDTADMNGFVIRDEELVISDQAASAVKYMYDDGVKVAKGTQVAKFFEAASDVYAQERISVLDQEIAKFTQLSAMKETSEAKPEELDKSITQDLFQLLEAARKNELKHFDSYRDSLLYLISERQIITGTVEDFSVRLSELEKEKQELESSYGQAVGGVSAPVSGYFISSVDGYESAVAFEDALDLTISEIDALLEQQPQPAENAVGKISISNEWYVACRVSANDALKLSKGAKVNLVIPSASYEDVPAVVKVINQEDKRQDAAVIFSCTDLDGNLIDLRKAPMQIKFEEYTGLRVSKDALHVETMSVDVKDETGKVVGQEEKEVQGVYILYGEVIRFREVCPLYTGDDYVICDPNPTNALTSNVLKLYDEVIVSGKDLYDGKYVR